MITSSARNVILASITSAAIGFLACLLYFSEKKEMKSPEQDIKKNVEAIPVTLKVPPAPMQPKIKGIDTATPKIAKSEWKPRIGLECTMNIPDNIRYPINDKTRVSLIAHEPDQLRKILKLFVAGDETGIFSMMSNHEVSMAISDNISVKIIDMNLPLAYSDLLYAEVTVTGSFLYRYDAGMHTKQFWFKDATKTRKMTCVCLMEQLVPLKDD